MNYDEMEDKEIRIMAASLILAGMVSSTTAYHPASEDIEDRCDLAVRYAIQLVKALKKDMP